MKPQGAECECTRCGEVFSSVSGFDLHYRPSSCKDPSRMRKDGSPVFFKEDRRDGYVWKQVRE